MTTINGGGYFAPSLPSANLNTAINGTMLTLAAGVLGSYFRPLNTGPFAFPQLPNVFTMGLGTAGAPPQAQMTASLGPNGQGNIDLGDGYTLQLNENNSEITIVNANTGETTKIWGDPHVDVDGKHAFDFWGTTTFQLGNGTKITINTEQWQGNPNAYVASELVITKGSQAITVNGISQNQLGDLSVTMGNNGRALDRATRDGYTLTENSAGAGWMAQGGGHVATQTDLNATAAGGLYAPGSGMPSLQELGQSLGAFLTFGLFVGMLSSVAGDAAPEARNRQAHQPVFAR